MYVDEKLRVIRNWTDRFEVNQETASGKWYGRMQVVSYSSIGEWTSAHTYHDDMVDEAYRRLKDIVEWQVDLLDNR